MSASVRRNKLVSKYQITELCPHCENEVTMNWDVETFGYQAYCPYCGKRLMLCDECTHTENGPDGGCDYDSDADHCSQQKNVKSSAENEHKSGGEQMVLGGNRLTGDSVMIIWSSGPSEEESPERLVGIRLYGSDSISLNDCYAAAVSGGYNGTVCKIITVIADAPLHGTVYVYGNHGCYWEKVGTTDGYA